MKTMSCKELGGPCNAKISANTWDEMVQKMTKHVVAYHPDTVKEMEEMHKKYPKKWGRTYKPKWDAAPESI